MVVEKIRIYIYENVRYKRLHHILLLIIYKKEEILNESFYIKMRGCYGQEKVL